MKNQIYYSLKEFILIQSFLPSLQFLYYFDFTRQEISRCSSWVELIKFCLYLHSEIKYWLQASMGCCHSARMHLRSHSGPLGQHQKRLQDRNLNQKVGKHEVDHNMQQNLSEGFINEQQQQIERQTRNNIIVQLVENQLMGLCCTEQQLIEIAGQISKMNFDFSNVATEKEASIVTKILQLKQRKDNLHSLLKNQPRDYFFLGVKSRIFYALGNQLARHNKFSDLQIQELTPDQIEKLVQYEHIEYQVEKFTQNFYLKHLEIKENTRKMEDLFCCCFLKYKEILENDCYFDLKNGLSAAKFSREGCSYDKKGIFILLNFLVRSIGNLERKGKTVYQIERAIKYLIQKLSNLYPPGKDLVGDDQGLKKTLSNIEIQWDKQKNPLHNNPPIVFTNLTNKIAQLRSAILERARIGEQQLPYLQTIIRQNCLEKCIGVDSNLKLYPENYNEKVLIRITEKLLFKRKRQKLVKDKHQADTDEEQEIVYQNTINELLESQGNKGQQNLDQHLKMQQRRYVQKVENKLNSKSSIEFNLSDMVRGKCMFMKIQDIIETIEKIKQFVESEEEIHPNRYRILEIESRFTNDIPISDITLKIALNEKIIAELQLSLQDNAATYKFAHKIYELQRSQIFSKIKTVFNYYEEYKKQFKQLLLGRIRLSENQETQRANKINQIAKYAIKHFKLTPDITNITLSTALLKIQTKWQILTDSKEKIIAQAVFERKMLKKMKEKRPLFQEYLLKDSEPKIFKSMLFYQIIKDIDITANSNEICVQYSDFPSYLMKNIFKSDECSDIHEKIGYLNTIRIVMKYEQLDSLHEIYKEDKIMVRKYSQALIHKIYGNGKQLCEWITKKGKILEIKEKFEQALHNYSQALEINEDPEKEIAMTLQRNKARVLIKLCRFEQANKILLSILSQYKEFKQYKNAIISTVLLSECSLKQKNQEGYWKYVEYYNKARKIERAQKVNFGGLQIANSEYRIAKQLIASNRDIKEGLNIHLRHAFEEYGQYQHPIKLLNRMAEYWEKYKQYNIPEPVLKFNEIIKQISINGNKLNQKSYNYLSKMKWPNLQEFTLNANRIVQKSCQYLSICEWPLLRKLCLTNSKINDEGYRSLSKAIWPQLQEVILNNCKLNQEGCKHLSQGQWPNLKILYLSKNDINAKGCEHLSQGKWSKLQRLSLDDNQIDQKSCYHLSMAEWPNLERLYLRNNRISSKGCQNLCGASWKSLQRLYLGTNIINDKGCEYISSAKWLNLQILFLNDNKVTEQGCEFLSKCNWPKLQNFCLNGNRINDEGCKYLQKTQWPNLQILELCDNGINEQGCQHISQSKWPNLQTLSLDQNKIKGTGCKFLSMANLPSLKILNLSKNRINQDGCEYLSKAEWPNLQQINLRGNEINEKGCEWLKKCLWPKLLVMDLSNNSITDINNCVNILKQEYPDTVIVRK